MNCESIGSITCIFITMSTIRSEYNKGKYMWTDLCLPAYQMTAVGRLLPPEDISRASALYLKHRSRRCAIYPCQPGDVRQLIAAASPSNRIPLAHSIPGRGARRNPGEEPARTNPRGSDDAIAAPTEAGFPAATGARRIPARQYRASCRRI